MIPVLCYSLKLISPIFKPCFKGDLVRQRERALHKHVEKINHLILEHCGEESWKESAETGIVGEFESISLWSRL